MASNELFFNDAIPAIIIDIPDSNPVANKPKDIFFRPSNKYSVDAFEMSTLKNFIINITYLFSGNLAFCKKGQFSTKSLVSVAIWHLKKPYPNRLLYHYYFLHMFNIILYSCIILNSCHPLGEIK